MKVSSPFCIAVGTILNFIAYSSILLISSSVTTTVHATSSSDDDAAAVVIDEEGNIDDIQKMEKETVEYGSDNDDHDDYYYYGEDDDGGWFHDEEEEEEQGGVAQRPVIDKETAAKIAKAAFEDPEIKEMIAKEPDMKSVVKECSKDPLNFAKYVDNSEWRPYVTKIVNILAKLQ